MCTCKKCALKREQSHQKAKAEASSLSAWLGGITVKEAQDICKAAWHLTNGYSHERGKLSKNAVEMWDDLSNLIPDAT
jgi:hypothetical protein